MSTRPDVSDDELVNRLVDNDRQAFELVYARYAGRMLRYTEARVKTPEDAEEIVQDIFVSLWVKRHLMENVWSLKAYLFGAAKHSILNYYRSAKVRANYARQFTLFLAEEVNTTEDDINIRELQNIIEREIIHLPERCQLAFRLSRFENLPIQAIAEKMNISTGTVENYITTALKHLRVELGK